MKTYDILNAGPRHRFTVNGRLVHNSTSEGPQAANLPSAGPSGHACPSCGTYFSVGVVCPGCGWVAPPGKPHDEWVVPPGKAAEQALEVMATRDVNAVERRFGSALHAVAGCLRGLYCAAPGKDLISSDYNSIEAVGLAMISGEQWRIDTFRTHGKIYEASAATAYGVPFEEFMTHRGYTHEQLQHPEWWTLRPENKGSHHPLRKKGKINELACLGADTLVLTDQGYVPIINVTKEHKLWDGIEWVSHEGLLQKGNRETLSLDGVEITPDHLVNSSGSWMAAELLASSASTLSQALATGSANLPASATTGAGRPRCGTCSVGSQTLRPVFDIAHAGPRNRFTIATDSGHLLVHNCGYGGWLGSAHAFGMPGTDEEITDGILKWRAASPSVVWLWGGQTLGKANDIRKTGDRWDRSPFYFGVEGAYIAALLDKGHEYPVNRMDGTATGISFIYLDDTLHCKLPSPNHTIKYHRPKLAQGRRSGELLMSYEGWNTNPKNGPKGWIRKDTWGSRVVENINQAICRDILRHAVRRLEPNGYPVVMHTYDEIVSEVDKGFGSHEEFERLVEERPPWAHDWPIRAPDSWRGHRYRKA